MKVSQTKSRECEFLFTDAGSLLLEMRHIGRVKSWRRGEPVNDVVH